MTKRSANILLGVVLVVFGSLIVYSASFARRGSGGISPAAFPTLAAIILVVLGVYTVIRELIKGEKTSLRFYSHKFLIMSISLVLYTILLRLLGYIISGMVIAAIIMLLMKTAPLKKTWLPMLLLLIIAPLAIYFIFSEFLLVPIPAFTFL